MASCDLDVLTLYSPESPDLRGFSVSGAVRVTVYGLSGKDMITFLRVRYCTENAGYSRKGCEWFKPTAAQISSAIEYQIGDCQPSLTADRNTIIIPYAGSYFPVIDVADDTSITLEVETVAQADFDDKEKGIDPCGLACKSETWKTTGVTRCNEHFIEQEEESNCGEIQWVRTTVRCGYHPSVPITITLDEDADCCGNTVVGYLFHENETRDPDATVKIADCDGTVAGYAYPKAGDGHTIPIEECDGNVVGYAANQSPTAPEMINCC